MTCTFWRLFAHSLHARVGGYFLKRRNVLVNRFLDRPTDATRNFRNGALTEILGKFPSETAFVVGLCEFVAIMYTDVCVDAYVREPNDD